MVILLINITIRIQSGRINISGSLSMEAALHEMTFAMRDCVLCIAGGQVDGLMVFALKVAICAFRHEAALKQPQQQDSALSCSPC
jgi:hypothetical protein